MRIGFTVLVLLLSLTATAQERGKVYKWVDENGVTHFGDSVPPEYSEARKDILNDQGVVVDEVAGKKTDEELAAEQAERELANQRELQRRADQALLATYLSVDEILMHRDRRVELFQAQSRVTELYLRNLNRRLGKLEAEASRYQPYNPDPEAQMVDPDLVDDINETKGMIERHERNLDKYRQDEKQIIERFDGDISRFKTLKGIDG